MTTFFVEKDAYGAYYEQENNILKSA